MAIKFFKQSNKGIWDSEVKTIDLEEGQALVLRAIDDKSKNVTPANVAGQVDREAVLRAIDDKSKNVTADYNWHTNSSLVLILHNSSQEDAIIIGLKPVDAIISLKHKSDENPKQPLQIKVKVVAHLDYIEISPNGPLVNGQTVKFTAQAFSNEKVISSDVTWTSPDISLNQATGEAQLNKEGPIQITAILKDGRKEVAGFYIGPAPVVPALTIENPPLTLKEGETCQLKATLTVGSSSWDVSETVKWESSDTTIATVEDTPSPNKGQVTVMLGQAGKTVTIKATMSGTGIPTSNEVTISIEASEQPDEFYIEIRPEKGKTALMEQGDKQKFEAWMVYCNKPPVQLISGIVWDSQDKDILQIDSNGLVTAVKVGDAVLIVSSISDNATGFLVVQVEAKLMALVASPNKLTLGLNSPQKLTVFGRYSDGTLTDISGLLQWNSDQPTNLPNTVNLNKGGLVQGLKLTDKLVTITASYPGLAPATILIEKVILLNTNDETFIELFRQNLGGQPDAAILLDLTDKLLSGQISENDQVTLANYSQKLNQAWIKLKEAIIALPYSKDGSPSASNFNKFTVAEQGFRTVRTRLEAYTEIFEKSIY